ncbi:MAG: hypothetical protein AAGB30_11295 [Pedobacter sp.]|nr:hypothetical protein [Pedobacter sp.]
MNASTKKILLISFLWMAIGQQAFAQSTIALKFDTVKMQFAGTKTEQAKYLLRYVQKYASLGDELSVLPVFIDSLMTDEAKPIRKRKLRRYLEQKHLADMEIGGSIDSPICTVDGKKASYFVIHDTSNFLTGATSFPNNIDSVSWSGNRLDNKLDFKLTHIFINRLGNSITSNNFSKPIHGTKFELPTRNPLITKNIKGSFIHIEVIQPRIADPGKKNDAIAIDPGFTDLQYERLALLYLIASFRKGDWLVPTFHAVIDNGIKDGHDDPQHFEMDKFDHALSSVYHQINRD